MQRIWKPLTMITTRRLQTIVHTPHGIHTMGAHGHMSALTTAPSTTAGGGGLGLAPGGGGGGLITTIVSPVRAHSGKEERREG